LLPIRYSDRPADLPGDEAPTGVLYLDSRDPGAELSSSARIALESLARQAAMAIQNAEVYGHVIEKARLDHEMYIAAALQQALLPTGRRRGPYYAAAARSVPCRSIGGDFFDYVELSGDALGIAIGDVAGKGPPAALLSMLLQGIFAGLASSSLGPAATLERVNQSMYRRATESRFASLFYGVLFADGRFTYSNAGNSPPLLVNRQDWRRLESDGLVVGLFERALYEEVTVRLQPGDVLIIFTDGVSEAIDPAANEFGEERIVQTVREAGAEDPDAVLDHLLAGLYRFTAGATQSDDITAMVVRYLGLS
jgi:sigma-B regulation protein RsbU (phosphoserine phosphatase)